MAEFSALLAAFEQLQPVIGAVVKLLEQAVPGSQLQKFTADVQSAVSALQGAINTHTAAAAK